MINKTKLKSIWDKVVAYSVCVGLVVVTVLLLALIVLSILAKCGLRFNINI